MHSSTIVSYVRTTILLFLGSGLIHLAAGMALAVPVRAWFNSPTYYRTALGALVVIGVSFLVYGIVFS